MGASLKDFVSAAALKRVRKAKGVMHRLPGVAFRSPEFLRLEFDRWLSHGWLFVGRGADLPNPGDADTAPGLPFFLVRGKDQQIRAFHNVCRHRGHRLICDKRSGALRFVCPYHSWTYDLEGRLVATPNIGGPDIHELEDMKPEDYGLVPVRCETWHDWIFINIGGEAPPLADFVKPLADQLSFVDFSKLRHFLTMSRRPIESNWKLCLEHALEPYHVPYVHKGMASRLRPAEHTMIAENPVVGCDSKIAGSDYTNDLGCAVPIRHNTSARHLLCMPNFFLSSYAPDIIVDTLFVPDFCNPRLSWMEQAWYTTSGRVVSAEAVSKVCEREEKMIAEDLTVMAEVQAGVESEVVDDGGILSPAWESSIGGFYKHVVGQLAE